MRRNDKPLPCDSVEPTRRRLLAACAGVAGGLLLSPPALALTRAIPGHERFLNLLQLHTNERLRVTYWADGAFDYDALGRVNHLLRDHRNGEQLQIDTALLDLLHRLQEQLGRHRDIHVISGYRSPKTNAMLRKVGSGVAKRSLHMQGRAIDIRVPHVATEDLYRVAKTLRGGGVGIYHKSRFIHLDTGRIRYW